MSDRVWTGRVNDDVRIGGQVGLYDTTLRDGEQTVGVVLDPDEKLEIARLLDDLGVDRIEAGFPRVSEEDRRAVELIQGAGLKAEVWGFSRALRADVDALLELGLRAAVIEAPVSERKLGALLLDHEEVLRRIDDAVSHAVESGMTIAFFGVDGTRAELSFLETVYKTAHQAGAQEAVVVDTIGVAAPEAVGKPRGERARVAGSRRADPLPRAQRLRARHGGRRRRRARGCQLGARDDQRDGGEGREREPG